eukprot:15362979-Ditylum_brightwellii.AAC.1
MAILWMMLATQLIPSIFAMMGMFIGLYSSASHCKSSPPELYLPGTDVPFLQSDEVCIWGPVISVQVVETKS